MFLVLVLACILRELLGLCRLPVQPPLPSFLSQGSRLDRVNGGPAEQVKASCFSPRARLSCRRRVVTRLLVE